MEFPIVDLLDDELSESWLLRYFHPEGLKCPGCGRGTGAARVFRRNGRSHVTVYRCRHCQRVYTVYSGTIFQGKHLRPAQVILLLRGICKGEASTVLARELGLSRTTVHTLRRAIQKNAWQMQPETPLEDKQTETDELFQNAGGKRRETRRSGPSSPPSGQQILNMSQDVKGHSNVLQHPQIPETSTRADQSIRKMDALTGHTGFLLRPSQTYRGKVEVRTIA